MLGRKTLALLLAVLVVVPLIPANAMIAKPEFGDAFIVDPQYSRPAFVKPGDEASVTLQCTSGCGETIELELVGFNVSVYPTATIVRFDDNNTIQLFFTIPEGLPEGLYSTRIYIDGAEAAWMPRNFYVAKDEITHLRIMHMTDIHFGASDEGINNDLKNTKYIMLSATLAEQMGVNLAVITGDIADVGTDVRALVNIYREYNQFIIPTLMVPGNHDWAQVPTPTAFLTSFYGKYINSKDPYYVVIDNFVFIGLDTMGNGYLKMEQIEFLNETLNRFPDKIPIIAFHHPIFTRPGQYTGPVDAWIGSVYSSWADHKANLEAFIEVVRAHPSPVVVLSGHIHRDADAILDGKIYFFTTTTANHGTPTYWGFKLIDVYANGTVSLVLPPTKDDWFNGRTSWNTKYVYSYEYVNENQTAVVWKLQASRLAEMDLSNATILFYVNASGGPYTIYDKNGVVNAYEVYSYGDYLIYKVWATVPTDEPAIVVVSDFNDLEPPTVEITKVSPLVIYAGTTKIKVYVQASDSGWGVQDVKVYYQVDGGEWNEAPTIAYSGYYLAQIDPVTGSQLTVKAVAVDFNGNLAESEPVTVEIRQPATTTTTTTQPEETTTTQPPAQETTTTTAQTTTTTSQAQTTTQAEAQGNTNMIIAAIIIIVVLAVVALFFRR